MNGSRPLRFIVAAMAVWAGGRSYVVWPNAIDQVQESLIFALPPLPNFEEVKDFLPRSLQRARRSFSAVEIALDPPTPVLELREAIRLPATPIGEIGQAASSPGFAALFLGGTAVGAVVPADAPAEVPSKGGFSGYAWLFQREGSAPGLATDGQLGGGQAGVRLDYALTSNLAATGRFSMPTGSSEGKEAAFGLTWQPKANWPVRLTVERRVALDDGGRNAFAAFVAGGVGPVDLPAGSKLDAYAQAGVVGAKRRDGFVDGSATITRPITIRGDTKLSLGGGVWGAAQPGLSRLDVGPRARVGTKLGKTFVGASLDWRQRVAGNAEPKSGVALTLDGSF
jgi:hypothetical protein